MPANQQGIRTLQRRTVGTRPARRKLQNATPRRLKPATHPSQLDQSTHHKLVPRQPETIPATLPPMPATRQTGLTTGTTPKHQRSQADLRADAPRIRRVQHQRQHSFKGLVPLGRHLPMGRRRPPLQLTLRSHKAPFTPTTKPKFQITDTQNDASIDVSLYSTTPFILH